MTKQTILDSKTVDKLGLTSGDIYLDGEPFESFKSIDIGAFVDSNIESIFIGGEINSISWSAFCKCPKLKRVFIGTNIRTISSDAFIDCGELSELYIPDSVRSIGDRIIRDCDKLHTISFYRNRDKVIKGKKEEMRVKDIMDNAAFCNMKEVEYIIGGVGSDGEIIEWRK